MATVGVKWLKLTETSETEQKCKQIARPSAQPIIGVYFSNACILFGG